MPEALFLFNITTMSKRPTTPFSPDAPPAVRQKLDATGQSLIHSGPASTLDFADQQHKDIDRRIFNSLPDLPDKKSLEFAAMVIYNTYLFSNNITTITFSEAHRLLREHRELEKDVQEALESKSFRKINMGEISTHYPIFVNLHKSPRNLTTQARSGCKSTQRRHDGE